MRKNKYLPKGHHPKLPIEVPIIGAQQNPVEIAMPPFDDDLMRLLQSGDLTQIGQVKLPTVLLALLNQTIRETYKNQILIGAIANALGIKFGPDSSGEAAPVESDPPETPRVAEATCGPDDKGLCGPKGT